MSKTMSATEARVHFGEMLRRIAENGEVVTVERGGKPLAVVISVEEYADLQRLRREQYPERDWWEQVEQARKIVRERFAGRDRPDINQLFDEMRTDRDEQLLAGIVSPAEVRRAREAGTTDR